jgi:hypothetical protein
MSTNAPRPPLITWLDDIEVMLLRISIKRWRARYRNERALELAARSPGMGGELGYRAPETGGEG